MRAAPMSEAALCVAQRKEFSVSAYVLTLLSASVAVCLLEMLLPKGDGGRTASHVRLVTGLFLLVALLNPLRQGLLLLRSAATGDLAELVAERLPEVSYEEDHAGAFESALSGIGRQEVETWVVETLAAVFAIPAEGCAVEVVCGVAGEGDAATLTLCELRIGLRGRYALEDPHPLEAYFAERLGCPCFVTVVS